MSSKNHQEEQLIDMSARTKLRIAIANQNEVEQNKKSFEQLNNAIENNKKTYSNQLNIYINELQKKRAYKRKNYEFSLDKLYWLKWVLLKYKIAVWLFGFLCGVILVISLHIVRNTEPVAMAQGRVYNPDNSYTIVDETIKQPQQNVTTEQTITLSPNFLKCSQFHMNIQRMKIIMNY